MIDERDINYVLKVAEELSFSQAAKRLYVTQPSLSQCIKKIEIELGIELFDRRTNPLKLTYAGELYVEKAKKIQSVKKELMQEIEDMSDLKCGHLKIGTSHSRTAYLLTRVLPAFRIMYPGIDISLVEGTTYELQEFALNDVTDIAFTYLPLRYDSLIYDQIVDEEILIALPEKHPISVKFGPESQKFPYKKVDFAEMAEEDFIVMKNRRKMRQIFFNLCESCEIKPKIILESQSLISAQALVGAGIGATLLTDTLALYHKLEKNPYYFALKNPVDKRILVAVYRKDVTLSKAAKAFIQLTKKIIKKIEE